MAVSSQFDKDKSDSALRPSPIALERLIQVLQRTWQIEDHVGDEQVKLQSDK